MHLIPPSQDRLRNPDDVVDLDPRRAVLRFLVRTCHGESMGIIEQVEAALACLDLAADLGAIVARDDEACLAFAARLDRETRLRPWAGRTLTVKDWIDVAGLPCDGTNTAPSGRVPNHDASAVRRLHHVGAAVLAKTQAGVEHAFHGTCRHPYDPSRTPGASSSGEAALIGRGASQFGLGSDSGGSIRLPAAWCGVVGFKPSFGLVPVTGHFPRVAGRSDGRTVIGPLASRLDDIIDILTVISGPDGRDPDCVPVAIKDWRDVDISTLRIAVVDESSWRPADSTVVAVRGATALLHEAGATIHESALPTHLDESLEITQRYWGRTGLSGFEVDRQLRDWDRFRIAITRASSNFDAVIGPVVADIAPIARPITGEDYVFTLPWSLTGWPAISLPFGHDQATGLPTAVQIAAPQWDDHVVLAIARWLEGRLRSE